jgi:hypothetical protein
MGFLVEFSGIFDCSTDEFDGLEWIGAIKLLVLGVDNVREGCDDPLMEGQVTTGGNGGQVPYRQIRAAVHKGLVPKSRVIGGIFLLLMRIGNGGLGRGLEEAACWRIFTVTVPRRTFFMPARQAVGWGHRGLR